MTLQTSIKNLHGEVNNLKTEVSSVKRSGHSSGAGSANKDSGRITQRWKQEGQDHYPTWWSTTYFWSHGADGHAGTD